MSDAESNLELQSVDPDIRAFYTEHYDTHYVSRLPILIQLSRQLRTLTGHAPDRQDGSDDGKDAKDDVQNKKLVAETGSGPLVTVDGLAKLIGQLRDEGSLDFLSKTAVRMRGIAEELHQFGDRLLKVQTDSVWGGVTHAASPASGGETVNAGGKA